MKRILPTWCKEVKKSMIDDDINVTELAERVGFSRNYVSGVVNGRVYAPEIAKVIGEDICKTEQRKWRQDHLLIQFLRMYSRKLMLFSQIFKEVGNVNRKRTYRKV